MSQLVASETAACDDNSTSTCCEDEKDEEFGSGRAQKTNTKCKRRKLRDILVSEKVSAVLDRTNTSIPTSPMILESVGNEVAWSTSPEVLSKSAVHSQRQRLRRKAAEQIRRRFQPSQCVVYWDGKLLPYVTGIDTNKVDRLSVLVTSLID